MRLTLNHNECSPTLLEGLPMITLRSAFWSPLINWQLQYLKEGQCLTLEAHDEYRIDIEQVPLEWIQRVAESQSLLVRVINEHDAHVGLFAIVIN